jgi:tetratricopeptide (TPR) repeat protein
LQFFIALIGDESLNEIQHQRNKDDGFHHAQADVQIVGGWIAALFGFDDFSRLAHKFSSLVQRLAESINRMLAEAERFARAALMQDGLMKSLILDTLANVYLRENRYREAIAALEQAQAIAPLDNDVVSKHLLETRALIAAMQSSAPKESRP